MLKLNLREIITATMDVYGYEVTVQGYVHYYIDTNYGADADGNRGERRTTVDEVTDITAYSDDFEEIALTKEDLERAADTLTRKFLEE